MQPTRKGLLQGVAACVAVALTVGLVTQLTYTWKQVAVNWKSSATLKAARQKTTIPKILHQVFKSDLVYGNYVPLINSCLVHNPDWRYMLWRDSDARQLIRDKFPHFLQKYTNYKDNLQHADSIRYIVLYEFGGVYLDMDVECRKALFPTLQSHSAFIDQERVEQTRLLWQRDFAAMNCAMGSVPKHPFFLSVVQRMLNASDTGGVMITTGPAMLTHVYSSYMSNRRPAAEAVTLLEPKIMSPLMDWQTDWRARCSSVSTVNPQSLAQRACAMLKAKKWSVDDTDNSTVAVHRFLHLGYGFGSSRRKKLVNITRQFGDRVNFYT